VKILVAVDSSSHSQHALEFITRMRWPAGSRMIVMSVVQPVAGIVASAYDPLPAPPELEQEHRASVHETVARAERLLRESGFATESRIADGDPRTALVETAKHERTNLIVVGSRGHSGVTKLMLGSVSSHVVTHAPCSVLVVKQPEGH
jgi:nucleotide-binding universal stress UspA family protein